MSEVFEQITAIGVVPVIAVDDAAAALPLADALLDGGLAVAEITFRTPAARDVIAQMATHRPQMLVGAGTVISKTQVDAAKAAGAQFALAPGLDLDVLAHAQAASLPYAPGIMTPSDLQSALKAGCEFVKFFPASAAGGPAMLKAISGPYAHTGVGFNPTGGVTLDSMADWLCMPQVRAVGGTWIATQDAIARRDWDQIEQNARAAVERVAEIRGGGA